MAQTKEERRAANRIHQARYQKTPNGKATQARHAKSDKYKVARCRYFKTEKGKKLHQVCNIRHQRLYPDRLPANNAVSNAIRDGRLVHQPCEVCGELAAQAHHPDYTKPLDVQWLCRKHHLALHQQLTEQE
jgi:hypothetical protein